MTTIQRIYAMLDWRQPEEVQKEGQRLAHEIKDLSLLYDPEGATPSAWIECWKILLENSDDDLLPYVADFLVYIGDMNRMGAEIVYKRLRRFSGKKLKPLFMKAVNASIDRKDVNGIIWLGWLSDLLDNKELKAELPEDVINLLEYCRECEKGENEGLTFNEYLELKPF